MIQLPDKTSYTFVSYQIADGVDNNYYWDYTFTCDHLDTECYLSYSTASKKWFGVISPLKWNIEAGLMETEMPRDHIDVCVELIPNVKLPDDQFVF